jgi:hypothetical protein
MTTEQKEHLRFALNNGHPLVLLGALRYYHDERVARKDRSQSVLDGREFELLRKA